MDDRGRRLVERAVREHCAHRSWFVHALNVRREHVHLVCNADRGPERVMGECKAWASRRLREDDPSIQRIWTRHGSTRRLTTEASLQRAIRYVLHEQ
jgi:REP element-mobilizing transposase RayT